MTVTAGVTDTALAAVLDAADFVWVPRSRWRSSRTFSRRCGGAGGAAGDLPGVWIRSSVGRMSGSVRLPSRQYGPVFGDGAGCRLDRCCLGDDDGRPGEIMFEPGSRTASRCRALLQGLQRRVRLGAAGRVFVHVRLFERDRSNGRTFSTSTSMTYEISYRSSSGSGSFPSVTTSSSADLAVAEVQALVTCTGPRPEQGGCGDGPGVAAGRGGVGNAGR